MSSTPVVSSADCPHCKDGPQTYQFMHRRYLFDVDLARQIVQDGREPEEVEDESVQWCVDTTRIYREHLPHVDIRYPGIIAHVFYPLPDGTEAHGHLLIDGNHRAARCVELGETFRAFILTEEESRRILIRGPRTSNTSGTPRRSQRNKAHPKPPRAQPAAKVARGT